MPVRVFNFAREFVNIVNNRLQRVKFEHLREEQVLEITEKILLKVEGDPTSQASQVLDLDMID